MDQNGLELARHYFNLGLDALQNEAHTQAADAFEKSLNYLPDRPSTLINLQAVYLKLGKLDEAWGLTEKILRLEPNSAEAYLNAGNVLKERFDLRQAREYFNKAITLNPRYETAWNNRAASFLQDRLYLDAERDFKHVLELNPDNADAYNNLGNLYLSLKDYKRAEAAFRKSLEIFPRADVYFNLGNLYSAEYKSYDLALAFYKEALKSPGFTDWLLGSYLLAKARVCDWVDFALIKSRVFEFLRGNRSTITPFDSLCIFSSASLHKKCAELYVQKKFFSCEKPKPRYGHKNIRIGYLSSDFRDHAVSYLMAGVIRSHDLASFETYGFDIGVDDRSETRKKVAGSFQNFYALNDVSDQQAADFIRKHEIDILIDLNGHSRWARTEILAYRPAPIQINYLGFPGTMGAPAFIDYIVADRILIPENSEAEYSEKVIRLPDCFQANDSERVIGTCKSRESFGLDSSKFIFGCFNHSGKLNPEMFNVWCSVLRSLPNSLLCLINDNPQQIKNLRAFAAEQDVDPTRLVFIEMMPYSEHLARYQMIDLVLDTAPFNGGTTTSDALWGGAPVLTCIGESFSGRMSASLLHAVGLPELITYSLKEYETLAINLATNHERLRAIRKKLAQNRLTTALFDTLRFTKNLEAAYKAIWARHEAGLLPDHINL